MIFLHGGTLCLADVMLILQWFVTMLPFGWGAWYWFRAWRRRTAYWRFFKRFAAREKMIDLPPGWPTRRPRDNRLTWRLPWRK